MKLDTELKLLLLTQIYDLQRTVGNLNERVDSVFKTIKSITIPEEAKDG